MTKKLGILFCVAALGAACGDDETVTGPTGSISGAIPGEAFKGQSQEILLIGNDTEWSAGVSVSFGEGVTVEDVQVASPTSLLVTVSSDGTTTAGPRDVVVTDTTGDLSLLGGFEILEATESESLGLVAQGSLSVLTIRGLDPLTPFDTTSEGGLFTPPTFPNIGFTNLPPGAFLNVGNVTASEIQGTLVVDVDVAPGTYHFDVVSGPLENQAIIPATITIEERAAIDLAPGASEGGTVAAPFDSQLYTIQVPAGEVAQVALASQSPDQSMQLLPETGRFADVMNFGPEALVGPGTYFVVLWDNAGGAGFSYNLDAFGSSVPEATAEAEPNDDSNNAQVLELPGHVNQAIMSMTDDDVYSVTVGADDMGKSLHVGTYGGLRSDTTIEILLIDEDEGKVPFAASSDAGFQDSLMTAPLDTPGEYLIIVSPSDFHQDGMPENYSLAVWAQ